MDSSGLNFLSVYDKGAYPFHVHSHVLIETIQEYNYR